MKNLFTLFLILSVASGFSQVKQLPISELKKCQLLPDAGTKAILAHQHSGSRSSGSCDTSDVLDYNTYSEINAQQANITYEGSLNVANSLVGQEITSSFITVHSAQSRFFSYALAAFDSLAFANYTNPNTGNPSQYSKQLATSTITLDSFALEIGITGDTTSAGKMKNDSLVFQFYPIVNHKVVTTSPKRISFVGVAALNPFIAGTQNGYLRGANFAVNDTFGLGQGFAVQVQYYNADTSSHCNLAFGFADSCGANSGLAAYPSPFQLTAQYLQSPGNTFWGEIDSTSPTTAAVNDISNAYYYVDGTGAQLQPANCSWVFWQNWQFFPQITVTNSLGLTINGSNPLALTCPTTKHTITTAKSGDLAGATYSWTSGQTTSSISIFNPGTYGVTVTNSQGCMASDQLVAAYSSGLNITPSFSAPDSVCRGQAAAFVNTTGVPGFSASWIYGQGTDSLQTTTSNTYTYTAGGSYNVTLILDSAGCMFETTQTVPVNSYCLGIDNVAFDNNISIVPNPSNGNINITINGADNNLDITIYNIIGQAVKSFATSDVTTVFNKNMDLSNLSNGTYLVKIQSGSKIATKKLVITK